MQIINSLALALLKFMMNLRTPLVEWINYAIGSNGKKLRFLFRMKMEVLLFNFKSEILLSSSAESDLTQSDQFLKVLS